MTTPDKLSKLLAEYTGLLGVRERRPLTTDEQQRVELLRDVLLETGAVLDAESVNQPRRTPRAAIAAEVSFSTPQAAAQAYSRAREVGTGGMALLTDAPLAKGSTLELTIHITGWAKPLVVMGEVVWCNTGAVGLAFKNLSDEDSQRLRTLVAENSSFLDRVRTSLATRGAKPIPAMVSTRRVIVMKLGDTSLSETTTEMLGLNGFFVSESAPDDVRPSLIVADGNAEFVVAAVAKHPRVPLVLVNVNGPESLMGRLMQVRPNAYVKKPASPAAILQTVRSLLRER